MATYEEWIGPTPNGGVKSIAYYFDEYGEPTESNNASECRIVELDSHGNVINELVGFCN